MTNKPLFNPGPHIVATPGAIDTFGREVIARYIVKHLAGDWGTEGKHSEIAPTLTEDELANGAFATSEGGRLNSIEVLLRKGNRIMSCYEIGDERRRLWIISYPDRETTALLPSDY